MRVNDRSVHVQDDARQEAAVEDAEVLLDSPSRPLTPQEVYDAGYWCQRAGIARTMADTLATAAERIQLLRSADAYDRLARYADDVHASTADIRLRAS